MSHSSTMAGGMASRCMAVGVVKLSSRSARATGGGVCKDSHCPNTPAAAPSLLRFVSWVQSRPLSLLPDVVSPSSLLPCSLSSQLGLYLTRLRPVLCLRHSSAASWLLLIYQVTKLDTALGNNVNDMIDHITDN